MATIKRTFSIPEALVERMTGQDVNWSAVVTESIRRHLGIQEAKDPLIESIDRLNKSIQQLTEQADRQRQPDTTKTKEKR